MAGTGNLELLNRLKRLNERISADINYGSHMATQMALGFLFLGGGNWSLGTSHRAVAGLVAALYPRYPISPTDNQSHLQALRHLWVLAIEPRCLITRDVETRDACPVPIVVTVYKNKPASYSKPPLTSLAMNDQNRLTPSFTMPEFETEDINLITPCILPEFSLIKSIQINSNRYWNSTLNLEGNKNHYSSLINTRTLLVKRKTGHLSYIKVGFLQLYILI